MKKWLQKRSFMVTIAFVIILIGIVVWFLIGTKTFGYYFHGAKIKNVEYIEVRIDGGEEDDIYKNQYKIEDSKNIETIMKYLKKTKYRPAYEINNVNNIEDRRLYLEIHGDSERYFIWDGSIIMKNQADISCGVYCAGMGVNNIATLTGGTCRINADSVLELRSMITEMLSEEIRTITMQDIDELVQEKESEWVEYEKYYYTDRQDLVKNGAVSNNCADFSIEGTQDILRVWYRYAGWQENGKDTVLYRDVQKVQKITGDGEETLYELESPQMEVED
ncbi:unknown [Roseburia sp. CAG:303]|nr:unknown [Roseburia sp. CAG:303]